MKKKMLAILLVLAVIAGLGYYVFYRVFYSPNIKFPEKSKVIYIHTGWNFDQVMDMITSKHIVSDMRTFRFIAKYKKYQDKIKPGRYRIISGISNVWLINQLISGKQEEETISIHNIRDVDELVDILDNKIEADSTAIRKALSDKQLMKKYGFNANTFSAMFIPGTYPLLWTDTPAEFIEHMHDSYEKFWTDERRKQAAAIPLTPLQVTILASIVQGEQCLYEDEKPVIAGLYINRLKKAIPLQSDPTLVYAKGDYSIKRVLDKDKDIESPYNTYLHTGLPPGPINMPEPSSLEAVLSYQKSDYIYMCAEADFSGRHHFSTTIKEQDEYATKYRQALSKRGIHR